MSSPGLVHAGRGRRNEGGVAGRSAEVVPLLAGRGLGIDVFVDERVVPAAGRASDGPPAPGEVRVQTAHDFPWRHARGQYDLVVYQLGNSSVHDFTWPYMYRWPGLVVLHDTSLHHARAQSLLGRLRLDAYRAEFAWNHPGVRPAAAGPCGARLQRRLLLLLADAPGRH